MIKPLLFLIHRVFNTFSGRKEWRFGKLLLVWISFVFPEIMRNSIFDLENGGSTYTWGRLIHEYIRYVSVALPVYGSERVKQTNKFRARLWQISAFFHLLMICIRHYDVTFSNVLMRAQWKYFLPGSGIWEVFQ